MSLISPTFRAAPVLEVQGTSNFRSTEGYATRTGVTRPRSLFRSDALDRVSVDGVQRLEEYGIVRVIDLRHSDELKSAPSALPAGSIETVHLPIFESSGLLSSRGVPSFVDLYRYIATDRVHALVNAVRLIADAPRGGVLVHCTAGKDRTGLVIATALLAVGVNRDQVVADYAASSENLSGEWAERVLDEYARRFNLPIDSSLRELVTASPAEALIDALELIDRVYGGVEAMLLSNGIDVGALERLHLRLTDELPATDRAVLIAASESERWPPERLPEL